MTLAIARKHPGQQVVGVPQGGKLKRGLIKSVCRYTHIMVLRHTEICPTYYRHDIKECQNCYCCVHFLSFLFLLRSFLFMSSSSLWMIETPNAKMTTTLINAYTMIYHAAKIGNTFHTTKLFSRNLFTPLRRCVSVSQRTFFCLFSLVGVNGEFTRSKVRVYSD